MTFMMGFVVCNTYFMILRAWKVSLADGLEEMFRWNMVKWLNRTGRATLWHHVSSSPLQREKITTIKSRKKCLSSLLFKKLSENKYLYPYYSITKFYLYPSIHRSVFACKILISNKSVRVTKLTFLCVLA